MTRNSDRHLADIGCSLKKSRAISAGTRVQFDIINDHTVAVTIEHF